MKKRKKLNIENQELTKMEFRITKKNPKINSVSYHLETIQDIADMITDENIENFLRDFELSLRSLIFLKAVEKSLKDEGGTDEGSSLHPKIEHNEKILFPYIEWIDD